MQLGDVFSDAVPDFLGRFGSFNIIRPPSGDPTRVDQTLACIPVALAHRSLLLIQSHLEALSAASMVDLMAFLFSTPVMPSSV